MKKIIFLFLFLLNAAVFCFASGKMDLVITNKTGAQVQEIIITDLETNKRRNEFHVLEKGESLTVKVKEGTQYNITLIDKNNHQYGIQNFRFTGNADEVQITHKNFIHQDIPSTLKRVFEIVLEPFAGRNANGR